MSVLQSIMSKILGHESTPPAGATPAAAPAPVSSSTAEAPAAPAAAAPATPKYGTNSAGFTPAPTPTAAVDVEAIMLDLEAKSGHKSNRRESIVDLMSLLGIDNSLAERKALAKELGYTGDMNDSATMNTWLHKAVMQKLAENGGQVPATLLD